MNTIICPHCKKEVEITAALDQQMRSQIMEEAENKHKEALKLAQEQAKNEAVKRLTEQFELQIKRTAEDLVAEREQKKQLIGQMEEITKELRNSKKERDEARLEMQKQLALESEKIRTEAQKKAEEEQRTIMQEKDKQLVDALKELDDSRRKLQQGSQQSQGEVFELEFETLLKQQFPHDIITPVGKGVKGGDMIQEVRTTTETSAGKILWELKNTKTWSEDWIAKLNNDKRNSNADVAILITEVLPNGIANAGVKNGVWVTQRSFVQPLAIAMRAYLIRVLEARDFAEIQEERMKYLYTYLTGTEFKNRIEAIVESFTNMQTEIEKEKRYFNNKWGRDEKNIRQVIDNTFGMHGDLKGIMGGKLPQMQGLDMAELEDGK